MFNLTPKQLDIVRFIVAYRERKGLAPTLQEIAQKLGVSKITVYEHVSQLARKGAITKQKYQSRSIQVAPALEEEVHRHNEDGYDEDGRGEYGAGASARGGRAYLLPLMGTIAAGAAIEAVVDQEDLDLVELTQSDRANYVLRVRGTSMIEEGIRDGDFVLVENRSWASNGETVVAIVGDNEATLKKFYKENGKIRLQPANAALQPIIVDECEIRGVVVGLVRNF